MLFVTVSLTFHSAQLTLHETNQILLSEFLSHLKLLQPEKNNLKDLISDITQSPTTIVSTIKKKIFIKDNLRRERLRKNGDGSLCSPMIPTICLYSCLWTSLLCEICVFNLLKKTEFL